MCPCRAYFGWLARVRNSRARKFPSLRASRCPKCVRVKYISTRTSRCSIRETRIRPEFTKCIRLGHISTRKNRRVGDFSNLRNLTRVGSDFEVSKCVRVGHISSAEMCPNRVHFGPRNLGRVAQISRLPEIVR